MGDMKALRITVQTFMACGFGFRGRWVQDVRFEDRWSGFSLSEHFAADILPGLNSFDGRQALNLPGHAKSNSSGGRFLVPETSVL